MGASRKSPGYLTRLRSIRVRNRLPAIDNIAPLTCLLFSVLRTLIEKELYYDGSPKCSGGLVPTGIWGQWRIRFTFPRIINNKLVIDFRAKEGSLVSWGYIHSGKYLGISIVATEKRDGRPNEVFKGVFFTETKPMRHQKKNYQTVMPVVTVSSSAFSDAIAKKITHVTLSVVETDGKPKKVFKTP